MIGLVRTGDAVGLVGALAGLSEHQRQQSGPGLSAPGKELRWSGDDRVQEALLVAGMGCLASAEEAAEWFDDLVFGLPQDWRPTPVVAAIGARPVPWQASVVELLADRRWPQRRCPVAAGADGCDGGVNAEPTTAGNGTRPGSTAARARRALIPAPAEQHSRPWSPCLTPHPGRRGRHQPGAVGAWSRSWQPKRSAEGPQRRDRTAWLLPNADGWQGPAVSTTTKAAGRCQTSTNTGFP
ncbi:hypothetical protein [Kitasatospora sp. NPDC085879]|uniref:hypothetical protein n=1 Tax=Kitasatospora sp. NPDC085879 TaxID=3154769 RepID=UPI00342171C6